MKKLGMVWFMVAVLYFVSPNGNQMTTAQRVFYLLGIAGCLLYGFGK